MKDKSMPPPRVMLLIDADNVSVDVIDQSVQRLLDSFGAVHVRRAYCTAEGAVKHQAAFKRLGIRPMVNLATGKNSTDIALAVDALDLVTSERPDVVVIASSDSDFAPLVTRLREKGCRVEGIGQQGKTGEETLRVYDAYTVLAHREGASRTTGDTRRRTAKAPASTPVKSATQAPASEVAAAPAKATARATSRSAAASADPPTASPAAKPAGRTAPRAVTQAAAQAASRAALQPSPSASSPAAGPDAGPASAPERPRSSRRGRSQTPAPAQAQAQAPVEALAMAAVSSPPAPVSVLRSAGATDLAAVLAALPELVAGQSLELNQVSRRLREAGLLGRNASSTRLLGRFADRFELLPAGQPNRVRMHPAA
jgi:uncharacterized protein (TIGR00288 family)